MGSPLGPKCIKKKSIPTLDPSGYFLLGGIFSSSQRTKIIMCVYVCVCVRARACVCVCVYAGLAVCGICLCYLLLSCVGCQHDLLSMYRFYQCLVSMDLVKAPRTSLH